jgi:hypothetical protein
MKAETKIYNDFIKRNKIVVGQIKKEYPNYSCTFSFFVDNELKIVELVKDDETGKYYAGDDDCSLTKISAVYYYCKNHYPIMK